MTQASVLGVLVCGNERFKISKPTGVFVFNRFEYTYEIKNLAHTTESNNSDSIENSCDEGRVSKRSRGNDIVNDNCSTTESLTNGSSSSSSSSSSSTNQINSPLATLYISWSTNSDDALSIATKRYRQLAEALRSSTSALEDAGSACTLNEQTSVADIGALFLENLKLRKELESMAGTSEVQYEQRCFAVSLSPGTWRFLSDMDVLMCWCPAETFKESHKKLGLAKVIFDSSSLSFSQARGSLTNGLITGKINSTIIGNDVDVLPWLTRFAGDLGSLQLLYRGSRDGFLARNYHQQCDGKGPLLTICTAVGEDPIFGGFNSHGSNHFNLSSPCCGSCWTFSMTRRAPIPHIVKFGSTAACAPTTGPSWRHLMMSSNMKNRKNCAMVQASDVLDASPVSFEGPLAKSLMSKFPYFFAVNEIEVFAATGISCGPSFNDVKAAVLYALLKKTGFPDDAISGNMHLREELGIDDNNWEAVLKDIWDALGAPPEEVFKVPNWICDSTVAGVITALVSQLGKCRPLPVREFVPY